MTAAAIGNSVRRGGMEPRVLLTSLLALLVAMFLGLSAQAASLMNLDKYAAIVTDVDTGEVLYARNPDAARHPASITKVMTLLVVFDALDSGKLSLNDRVYISKNAARQECSCSGLQAGEYLTVEQAIRVLATKSANDVAVAVAERVAGSDVAFAQLMTEKAHALGMNASNFVNPNGLTHPAHMTTARDLATMSSALIRQYPHYYAFFSQQSYTLNGRNYPNHNKLLGKFMGLDGIKTGYTSAAGFTLAASAQREGKRLVAIVLGAPSGSARNANISDLLNAGFDVLRKRDFGQEVTVASLMSEPEPALPLWPGAVLAQGSTDEDVEGRSVFEPTLATPQRSGIEGVLEQEFGPTSRAELPSAFQLYAPGMAFPATAWLR